MFARSRPRVRFAMVFVLLAGPGAVLAQWQQDAKLLPADGAPSVEFGNAVALSGERIALGAHLDGAAAHEAGAVYIFVESETGWHEELKLIAPDAAPRAEFGAALTLRDDMLVVGAPGSNAAERGAGCAYVFRRTPDGWVEEVQLTASDARRADAFGCAVAAGSDWVIVGAPLADTAGRDAGAAYVYRYDGTAWVEQAKLVGSNVAEGHEFGSSVAFSGNRAIVGAPRGDAGAAYVFSSDGSSWVEEGVLVPSDGSRDERFGASVALCADVALLGAPRYDDDAGLNIGAAYVFQLEDGGWSEVDRLTASDADPADYFGIAVALDVERAVVGAHFGDDGEINSGSVYVYRLESTHWVAEAKLIASDGAAFDMFGLAVAVNADRVVVGAPEDDDFGDSSGSAYVFGLAVQNEPPVCDAGPDQTVECQSGPAVIVLDGTGSTDPDEDALTYRWATDCPDANWDDPNSATALLTLYDTSDCARDCNVTLTVSDGVNPPVSCTATVTITDSTPPLLTCPLEVNVYPGDPDLSGIPEVEDCDPNVELAYSDREAPSDCAADPVQTTIMRTWTATDSCGNTTSYTQTITVWRVVLPLDIKPESCENAHNPRSNGYLPVALLGTPEIDARDIDVYSLWLRNADCAGDPVAPNYEPPGPQVQLVDVGTPISIAPCECHSDEPDGIPDVLLKFPSPALEQMLRLSPGYPDAPLEIVLTGTISSPGSPFDGAEFIAVDCLRLVGQDRRHGSHGR